MFGLNVSHSPTSPNLEKVLSWPSQKHGTKSIFEPYWTLRGFGARAPILLVSVDKDGKKLENRHSKSRLNDSMSAAQLQAVWDAANRGGAYSVEVGMTGGP